ncbi:hypothetical protein [Halomonas sp. BM-2019]|uniref:hypothetical protein n=1 Tax=Halomonas sp. BM-2019 TaxID=2811227 RepID=UPI001B3C33CE|nr:MAG: hypothetical protein J5F18_19015 [Halomonas sp. BM-2019]
MSCGCGTEPDLNCRDDARRQLVRAAQVNGLDYLEVSDDQRRLTIYFLGPAPEGIDIGNIEICGGVRERDIKVIDVQLCPQTDPEYDNCLVVTVDRPGDFSTYCLCLVNLPEGAPFDPRYRCLEFSFKAACPSDLDCKPEPLCPEEARPAPEIDYLAKDYTSFHRLILDRLAVVMPEWTERHVPDIGITLVELLAYVGDYLSYQQDAVATEAYLGTARQRISVRRHARLVDYHLHEGCNARAWVTVWTSQDHTLKARDLSFVTSFQGAPDTSEGVPDWVPFEAVPENLYEVFAPLVADADASITLHQAHNRIRIYTWGERQCCLPKGATAATLVDGSPPVPSEPEEPTPGPEQKAEPECPSNTARPIPGTRALYLQTGDVLILEEVMGPNTANTADADPMRRHAVRLTEVTPSVDPLTGQPLLEVAWGEEDALPMPFCVSTLGPAPECVLLEDVSVVRGNVVLVDHGRWRPEEDLGCVPLADEEPVCVAEGQAEDIVLRAGRFAPAPIDGPLTFATPLDTAAPASLALRQDPHQATASLAVRSTPDAACVPDGDAAKLPTGADPRNWTVVRDLLASARLDTHVAVEVDDRRRARLRFGDNRMGRAPDAFSRVLVRKRTGNGPDGNIGADKLTIAVQATPIGGLVLKPRNPLPAVGGTAPESVTDAKLLAPYAFSQVLARAITPEDYADIATRHPKVQRAAAELRWNGSWYEVRVAIDALGAAVADDDLLAELFTELSRFRRIGHDLAVRRAAQIPLDIAMTICVQPTHLRAHVEAALHARFGTSCLADGSLGYFHPDALSFGDDISLSRLMATAQAIEGVESVQVTRIERRYEGPNGELAAGVLPIGALEIAQADSDPNAPENGRVTFTMRGGR